MGGQVLGGGVIFLVAVTLWLLYLLPSWQSRHQYNAAERNAVRLNQALRVLAETSETPEEVRLELTARTASAQQKLARQTLAERERAQLEVARQELAAAKQEARAVRDRPEVRMARARRRARLTATVFALLSLAGAVLGLWMQMTAASATLLWASGAVFVVSVLMLQQMSRVARRAARRVAPVPQAVVEARRADVQDVVLPTQSAPATWEPRSLPRPLAATSGSRASLVQDAADARAALRRAAVEEAKRERAEQAAPPSIETARVAKAPEESPFARMGYVDDAEIEDHVRRLLSTRRAAG